MIACSPTQNYLGLGYQAVSIETNRMDASAFTHLHFDFLTDEANVDGRFFNIKLVDFSGNLTDVAQIKTATGISSIKLIKN